VTPAKGASSVETNRLTFPAFDPFSGEPAYKLAAVRVEKG